MVVHLDLTMRWCELLKSILKEIKDPLILYTFNVMAADDLVMPGQTAKTLGLTLIQYWSDRKVLDQYLINVDPRVFVSDTEVMDLIWLSKSNQTYFVHGMHQRKHL